MEWCLLCLPYILNGAGFKYSWACTLKPAVLLDLAGRTNNSVLFVLSFFYSSEGALGEEIIFAKVSSGETVRFTQGIFYYCGISTNGLSDRGGFWVISVSW